MQIEKTWTMDSIKTTQDTISKELVPFMATEQYVEAIEHCLRKVLPVEGNKNSDLSIVCYIISTLNLISLSAEASKQFGCDVSNLEKIAKVLLHKNNIKAGKSKLSFLHGQLKQSVASILKSDGDTWGALWESSLGLFLSRGSANPILPFQHLSFAIQTIDRGLPLRVMEILSEMSNNLSTNDDQDYLSLLTVKALRLSGNIDQAEELLEKMVESGSQSDRLVWEQAFVRAIKYDETKEFHRTLFSRNKPTLDYAEGYLKYALWMKAQPSKLHAKLCPKTSVLKRVLKGYTSNSKYKKILKVISAIEDCYDVDTPLADRVNKIGKIMPVIETLEAEYKVLALSAVVRFFNQRQKQMASLFHGEYQSMSLKMSEGHNPDVFNLFSNKGELETIRPFYDSLHSAPEKGSFSISPVNQVLFKSAWQGKDLVKPAV